VPTLYGRGVRVRRDLLILGAAAAAVLVAIVAFAASNTVKTQALSVYRKLDVSSRSEAVARGCAVGLLDG